MPVELTFADDGLGVLLIGKDVVEGRDIVDIKEGLVGEIERLGGRPYWLVDFTEVNELRMSGDHMARLIEIDNEIATTIPEPNSRFGCCGLRFGLRFCPNVGDQGGKDRLDDGCLSRCRRCETLDKVTSAGDQTNQHGEIER